MRFGPIGQLFNYTGRTGEWHRWFAWRPVWDSENRCYLWLEWVDRWQSKLGLFGGVDNEYRDLRNGE